MASAVIVRLRRCLTKFCCTGECEAFLFDLESEGRQYGASRSQSVLAIAFVFFDGCRVLQLGRLRATRAHAVGFFVIGRNLTSTPSTWSYWKARNRAFIRYMDQADVVLQKCREANILDESRCLTLCRGLLRLNRFTTMEGRGDPAKLSDAEADFKLVLNMCAKGDTDGSVEEAAAANRANGALFTSGGSSSSTSSSRKARNCVESAEEAGMRARLSLAAVYYLKRQYRKALGEYEKVMFGGCEYPSDTLFNVALCYKHLGQEHMCLEALKTLLKEAPTHAEAISARFQWDDFRDTSVLVDDEDGASPEERKLALFRQIVDLMQRSEQAATLVLQNLVYEYMFQAEITEAKAGRRKSDEIYLGGDELSEHFDVPWVVGFLPALLRLTNLEGFRS